MTVFWFKRKAHTRCPAIAEPRAVRAVLPGLRFFNLLWWRGSVCAECVPDPILPEASVPPWPFS